MTTTTQFKALGLTDSVNTCECCGKTNLKCTVVLESEATGVVHFGRDCAGTALYGKKSTGNTKRAEQEAKAKSFVEKYGQQVLSTPLVESEKRWYRDPAHKLRSLVNTKFGIYI